ncbi:MAG: AraC family transcriptional regulator ligand-binding domain-containing protein, partial [Actinomycetota bacterium]
MDDNHRAVPATTPPATMLANLLSATAAHGLRRGLTMDSLASAAGLEPHELLAPPERVPEGALAGILHLLVERFPDEPIGLEAIASAPLTFLGPLEPMARVVPDLRTGIEALVDFRSILSTDAHLEFVDDPTGPMVVFGTADDRFDPNHHEMAVAVGVRIVTDVLGLPAAVRAACFRHSPIAPIDRYEALLSVPARFDAPVNALLLHAHRLDDPIDPEAGTRLRVLRTHLEIVRDELVHDDEPPDVRHIRAIAARNASRGIFDGAALGAELGMSERTLQRRLGEHGRSVRSVIDEVREAAAREMLADETLSVLGIALALGYSTDSAFRRAFRRWTGQSPADYRRARTISTAQRKVLTWQYDSHMRFYCQPWLAVLVLVKLG